MENWADELISEYQKNKRQLQWQKRKLNPDDLMDQQDLSKINSMISEMEFVLEWLETGRQPGNYRGADIRGIYRYQSFGNMDFIPDIVEQLEEGPKQLRMTEEEKIILADIFASLSFREKQCYVLYEASRMSMGKIADELGVSKGSVQDYIQKARKKIEKRIG